MREIVKSQIWAISNFSECRLFYFWAMLWEVDYLAVAAGLMCFFQKNYLLLAEMGVK